MSHHNPLFEALLDPGALINAPTSHWEEILALSRRYGIAGRWHSLMSDLKALDSLDRDLLDQLSADAQVAAGRVQALRWEMTCAKRVLDPLGIPSIMLKGAAYIAVGMPAARTRLSADLDILVPHRALADVEAAFKQRGWRSHVSDDYDEAYFRRWMHEIPPLQHAVRGTVIDVHHNILPLTAPLCPNAETLLDAAVVNPASQHYTLAPEDMLIHAIVHSFYDGEFQNPLRDVLDICDLASHLAARDAAFWDRFTARALTLGFARPVSYGLAFATDYFRLDVPRDSTHALAAAAGGRALKPAVFWSLKQLMRLPARPTLKQKIAARVLQARSHVHKMPARILIQHLGYKTWRRLRERVRAPSSSTEAI